MSYVSTLLMVIILNLTSAGSGILLVFGVLLKRKVLIIPWLIIGEVMVVFYFTFMIVIIFIEAKLFGVGKSVFGLFSVIFLCLAFVQAYLWIVVQVRYESKYHRDFNSIYFFRVSTVDSTRRSSPKKRT